LIIWVKWINGVSAAVAVLLWAQGPAFAQPLFNTAQDPVAGSRVFGSKGCSKCHSGGKIEPDLARIPRARSFYDFAGAMWNHLPRMAERMRELKNQRPSLSPEETGNLIAFLYTLNYFDPPGNAQAGKKGRELASEKSCLACHSVDGEKAAPALARVKGLESPATVIAAMWNHSFITEKVGEGQKTLWPQFRAEEMAHLAAFLQTLGRGKT
jgi:mono/diheme cytochrome c family protein